MRRGLMIGGVAVGAAVGAWLLLRGGDPQPPSVNAHSEETADASSTASGAAPTRPPSGSGISGESASGSPEEVDAAVSDWRSAVLARRPIAIEQGRQHLRELGDRAVPPLSRLAENDPDPVIRANATAHLAYLDRLEMADFFRQRLGDASEFVRESAVVGLARLNLWNEVRAVAEADLSARVRDRARNELARSP